VDKNKVGLEAVFETDAFMRGMNKYLAGVRRVNQNTRNVSMGISSAGRVIQTALGTALGYMAAHAIPQFVSGLKDIGTEAVLAASRVEELWLVLGNLAAQAGIAQQEMRNAVRGIIDYGIKTQVAQQTVTQFIRYQLDLSKANELARVAQDAAVISMKDSSEALDLLIQGIIRHETRLIRSAGITVDAEKAFWDYAEALDISTNELTENMRIQALLNKVLEEGARITGTYETAMLSAGKQLRTLVGREFPELLNLLGAPFQDAFRETVVSMRDMTNAMRDAVSPGLSYADALAKLGTTSDMAWERQSELTELMADGRLYDSLRKLGAITAVVAEGMADFARDGVETLINFGDSADATMWQIAENALTWGANISANLATGLVRGAVMFLTTAMNTIASFFAGWLAPGSPPRLLPDLPDWGAGWMTEILHGFTQADFDVLRSVQQPLRAALNALADMGGFGEDGRKAASQWYVDLSQGLIDAMGGAEFDSSILDTLSGSVGDFGDEIAKLVELELDLAAAIEQVEDAQRALDAARKAEKGAQAQVRRLKEEYQALLRAGASDDVLKAKLDELNVAELGREAAIEQRIEAEGAVDAAKEQASAAEDVATEQERLLDTLIDLAQAQADAWKVDPVKDLAGAVDDLSDALDELDFGGTPYEFVPEVDEDFEALKDRIRAKLRDIFKPIVSAWRDDIKPMLEGFRKQMKPFLDMVSKFYDAAIAPAAERILGIFERFGDWWDKHGPAITKSADKLLKGIARIFGKQVERGIDFVLDSLEDLADWFDENGPYIEKAIDRWVDLFLEELKLLSKVGDFVFHAGRRVMKFFLGLSAFVVRWAAGDWDAAVQGLKDGFDEAFTPEEQEMVIKWLNDLALDIETEGRSLLAKAFAAAFGPGVKNINLIGDALQEMAGDVKTWIEKAAKNAEDKLGDIADAIRGFVNDTKKWWFDVWDSLIERVGEFFENLMPRTAKGLEHLWEVVDIGLQTIRKNWKIVWTAIKIFAGMIWDKIKTVVGRKVDELKSKIDEKVKAIKTAWGEFWKKIKTAVETAWDKIKEAVGTKITEMKDGIIEWLAQALKDVKEGFGAWEEIGKGIVDLIVTGIENGAYMIVQTLLGKLQEALDAADRFIGGILPGDNDPGYEVEGAGNGGAKVKDPSRVTPPGVIAPAPTSTSTTSVNMPFNVSVRNEGDLNVIRQIVRQEIRGALAGAG